MHANVPQFIEMEDKIAFGLTWKQLLWMGGMVACLIILYGFVDRQIFLFVAIPVIAIFAVFSFYRPQGMSFVAFLSFVIQYFARPKKYVWKREYKEESAFVKYLPETQKKKAKPPATLRRIPSQSQLKRIAWILDTKK